MEYEALPTLHNILVKSLFPQIGKQFGQEHFHCQNINLTYLFMCALLWKLATCWHWTCIFCAYAWSKETRVRQRATLYHPAQGLHDKWYTTTQPAYDWSSHHSHNTWHMLNLHSIYMMDKVDDSLLIDPW